MPTNKEEIEKKYPYLTKDKKTRFSKLMVCESAAGFYIGRMAWEVEDEFEEPGSRETEYFMEKAQAVRILAMGSCIWRNADENLHLYEDLGLDFDSPDRSLS